MRIAYEGGETEMKCSAGFNVEPAATPCSHADVARLRSTRFTLTTFNCGGEIGRIFLLGNIAVG